VPRQEPVTDLIDSPQAGPAAIRGSGLRVAGFLAGLLLTLGSAPLIFRHLGVVEFGRYLTVLSLVTLAAGLSEGGINAIALREYATTTGAERARLLANLIGIRIVLTVLAVGAAVLFAVGVGYESAMVVGTVLAGAGLLAQVMQSLLATSLQGELRFGWATVLDILRQAVLVAFLVGLVLAGAGIVPLLAAQIPAGLAVLVLTVPLVRRLMPLRPRFERAVWGPLLRETFPYALSIAVNVLYFRVAILFMSLLSSPEETGHFAASFRIMEVLIGIPPVIVAAAFPILARAARDDPERFAFASGRMIEVALIVGVWATLCLEIGAGLAIELLAGDEFAPATPVLRIQAPAIIATFLAVAATYPLLSIAAYRDVLVANAFALATSVTLLTLLTSPHGAQGAASATLAAECVLAVTTVGLLLRRRREVSIAPGSVGAVLLAALAGLAVLLVPALPIVVQVAVASVAFFGVLHLFGKFPVDLVHAVLRR
jgi:O-antigen/teichoic acid export membrane protein